MSRELLNDLLQSLQWLASEKITERRRGAETLRQLLQTDKGKEIILDTTTTSAAAGKSSSSRRSHSGPTWDGLLEAVQDYVYKEFECIFKLEQSRPNPSSSGATNRKKLKQDVADTFRILLKAANTRGGVLRVSDVLGHIKQVLKHSKLQRWLVSDYTHILLNHVFPYSHYTLEMTQSTWAELQELFCKFYVSPPENLEQSVAARVIHTILVHSCQQFDVPVHSWYWFFTESIKPAVGLPILEHLLSAFNVFCSAVASNARGRLCKLGEELVQPVIQVWSKCSPSIKDQILKFLCIQLRLHHPRGVTQEDTGAWASSDSLWRKDLEKMSEFIMTELQLACQRLRTTSKGDTTGLPTNFVNFVDFATDVMQQVYFLGDNPDRWKFSSPRGKKPKVESSWSAIRDQLKIHCLQPSLIVWLQLLAHLFTKQTISFPTAQIMPLLVDMHQIQLQLKRSQCLHWLFTAIRSIACYCISNGRHQVITDKTVWHEIWTTTLKTQQYKMAEEAAYQLLATLLNMQLVESVDTEPWKLICSAPPTQALLFFVLSLLKYHKLPESLQLSSSSLPTISTLQLPLHYPYRVSLLCHLCPLEQSNEHNTPTTLKSFIRLPVIEMSTVLVGLVQPSCSIVHLTPVHHSHWINEEFKTALEQFETCWSLHESVYLQSSCDENPLTSPAVSTVSRGDGRLEQPVDSLCHVLFELLNTSAQSLLQALGTVLSLSEKANLLSALMEAQTYLACVILHVLYFLKVTGSDVETTELYKTVPVLLKQVSTYLRDPIWSEVNSSVYQNVVRRVLKHLLSLVGHGISQTETRSYQKFCLLQVPPELLEDVVSMSKGKFGSWVRSLSVASSTFSLNEHSSGGQTKFDDDDIDLMEDSGPSDHSDVSSTSLPQQNLNILSSSLLSDKAIIQQEACELLVHWSSANELSSCWIALKDILNEESVDLSSPRVVQLIFKICTCLVSLTSLSQEQLDAVLQSLRRVLSKHRKNYFIHKKALKLLNDLMSLHSNWQLETSSCINLLSAFWRLYTEGTLCADVRCCLADALATAVVSDVRGESLLLVRKRKKQEDDSISIRNALIKLLNDKDHSVRIHLAKTITVLFSKASSSKEQEMTFEDVKETLKNADLHGVQSDLDELSKEDESVNFVSSMICTLRCIAYTAVSCERHVISLLVSATANGNIDSSLMKKVLKSIAEYLGYASEIVLMEEMLSYLVSQWLNEGVIEAFPHQLFSFSDKNKFFKTYYRAMVPHLVNQQDLRSLETISTATSMSKEELLQDCLPLIMVQILTSYAERSDEQSEELSRRQATEVHSFILSILSKETLDQTMKHSLCQFVVELLTKLHESPDTNSFIAKYCNVTDPEPIPPHYSSAVIRATLDYLPSCYSSSGSDDNIITMLSKSKELLQTIMLQLNLKIFSTHRLFQRKRLFLAYSLFATLVCRELKSGLNGTLPYMVMDIVHSASRILRCHDNVDDLIPLCCDTMATVCKEAVQHCPEVIGRHCHVIVNTLLPIAQLPSPNNKQAVALLDFIIQNGQIRTLQDHLISLDPLPTEGPVKRAAEQLNLIKASVGEPSLSEEIQRFCSVRQRNNQFNNCSIQGLRSLSSCLCSSQPELYHLAQRNDPYTSNPVLLLVQTLVNVAKSLPDSTAVLTEVGKCLGQLGSLELSFIAAPVTKAKFSGDVLKQEELVTTASILELLTSYLSDENIKVVEASSNCLRAILATPSGANSLSKLEANCPEVFWYTSLEPFRQTKKKKATADIADCVPQPNGEFPLSWKPLQEHSEWLRQLVCTLLTSGGVISDVLSLVEPVCRVKPDFCEYVFPLAVRDILSHGDSGLKQRLSQQICEFFSIASEMDPLPTQSINSVLKLVTDLRRINRLKKGTSWDNNFWLDLNFLDVAKAALKCSSYFTSLLYLEIWYTHLSLSCESAGKTCDLSEFPHVQELLLKVYGHIGEADGSYGACILYSPKEELARRLDEHEGRWDELLTYSNWESTLSAEPSDLLVKGCRRMGYYHILETYMRGASNDEYSMYQQEMAWRCSQWRDDSHEILMGNNSDYHTCIQSLLLAMRDNKKSLFDEILTKARCGVVKEMSTTSLESVCNIYPYLTKLQTLSELELAAERLDESDCSPRPLILDWQEKLSYMTNDFELTELVLSVRSHTLLSLLPHEQKRTNRSAYCNEIQSGLVNLLQTKAKLAREAGQYQVAKGSLIVLKHLVEQYSLPSWTGQLEEAKLYWAQGKSHVAMLLVKNLLEVLQHHQSGVTYPTVLTLYGNWLAETLSENPQVIMDNYLEKAVRLLESRPECKEELVHAYMSLGRFSDSQYRRISSHMTSPHFEAKRKLLDRSKTELESMSVENGSSADLRRHVRQLSKHNEEDEFLIRQHERDRQQFLEKSIINYSHCLLEGDQYNLRIFRLISLWFDHSTDSSINELVKEFMSDLPSYKFLPVLYQLAARMSSLNSDPFQHILQEILYRLGVEHTHHALYVILALSNAGLDNEYPPTGYVTGQRGAGGSLAAAKARKLKRTSASKLDAKCTVDDEKVKSAHELLSRLRTAKGELVRDISALCEAYVDLAYHDVNAFKTEKKPIRIPGSCPLLKLKLKNVAIPTADLPIDPSGRYSSLATISSYDNHISLCGGVNLPKVISCLGSDGKRRRQLVKGRDDLRQDAVMQQVFAVVNQLLRGNTATASRKLLVRTYKVIPLSQCSGVVEWCEGTVPLGTYLVGTPQNPFEGAHSRYRPNDWKNNECRTKFHKSAKHDKLATYDAICKNFKPVFGHFFMECFTDPALWYERRLSYTRSIATSSIVGYIMGLGDRHIQNILIDKQTAELIHIDLGVAFEQGRTLPTPEVIPFRLTRDLINGMGLTGEVGVFKRCCEETLAVMRTSHEELKTIVQVLLHDPLYIWTLTQQKVRHIQSTARDEWTEETHPPNGSNNKMAERVLLRLQEKLDGIEDGVQLSVSGQVTHLIQEATDTVNLSGLFHGWQPWV